MQEITILDTRWDELVKAYGIVLPKRLARHYSRIKFVKMNQLVTSKRLGWAPVCFPPIMLDEKFAVNLLFPTTGISESGEVLRLSSGTVANNYSPQRESHYMTTSVYDPIIREYRDVVTHRMVAMTWIENDDYYNKPVVNHKDGDKLNPTKSNLEWVTQTANHDHAVDSGLRQDLISCVVKNTKTKERFTLPSLGRAKRMLGLARLGTSDFKDGCFKKNEFEVRLNPRSLDRKSTKRRAFKLRKEAEEIVVPSLREAARKLGTVRSVIKNCAKKQIEFNGWKIEEV